MVSVVMRILNVAFLLTFLSLNAALAMDYAGILTQSEHQALRLKDDNSGKVFELTFEDKNVEALFHKLKSKDYVSFSGARSATVSSIRVDSINFVGLNDLLSVWKGDDRYCYAFLNFTEFVIYPIKSSACGKPPKSAKTYAYTINPTEFNNWVILLSNEQANYAADLALKSSTSVEISLYDSNTGYILKVIKLRK